MQCLVSRVMIWWLLEYEEAFVLCFNDLLLSLCETKSLSIIMYFTYAVCCSAALLSIIP